MSKDTLFDADAVDVRILHLNVKKKWFDMIKSGEKKEEYRQDKLYWKIRFVKEGYWLTQTCKVFDVVRFKNGYGKNAPWFDVECKGISIEDISAIKPEWFGNIQDYQGLRVFVIRLGHIINFEE